ncbi:hypothetical protein [Rhodoblastus acidophilus]|uniref:hypothetical protein n=1 Tax=Rhodoblastus acidophilus TaxID=1074 RepID=UPI00113282A8|nr:hypothetical protein [Rhodoblastus acidophilus]
MFWNAKAEHHGDEGDVLRAPDAGVGSGRRHFPRALRLIERPPAIAEKDKSGADQQAARDVQHAEMRIALGTEDGRPEMTGVVGHQVCPGIMRREPSRQEVDRQLKAVHFGKQRQHESREHAEFAPVLLPAPYGKTAREKDEEDAVDDDQRPKAVGGSVVRHGWSSLPVSLLPC